MTNMNRVGSVCPWISLQIYTFSMPAIGHEAKRHARQKQKNRKGGDAFDKSPTILKRLSHEIIIVKTAGRGNSEAGEGCGRWGTQ
jgi:hypothetical protein